MGLGVGVRKAGKGSRNGSDGSGYKNTTRGASVSRSDEERVDGCREPLCSKPPGRSFCGFSDSVLLGPLRMGPVIIPSYLRKKLG